jgi:hypothetical protein
MIILQSLRDLKQLSSLGDLVLNTFTKVGVFIMTSERSYDIDFITYSGMPIPILQDVDKETAKAYANKRKRRFREKGFYVQYVNKGTWEFNDENGFMVSDQEGFLTIRKASKQRRRSLYG